MTAHEATSDARIARAIAKMTGLHDGEAGVADAVACGRQAIPALRQLLFEREPSGLYQPRRWAAEALAILCADDVLFDFLAAIRPARDPVERAGDDAVINTVARLLSAARDERTFDLLLDLSTRKYWPGVVGALAAFHREEAIPYLVGALGEDDCRLLAEPALAEFGRAVLPELLKAATTRASSGEIESETSIRKRESALHLLIEIGLPPELWPSLRRAVADPEPRIALPTCELCLLVAPRAERAQAVQRLIGLLDQADWRLEREIAECLVRHDADAAPIIARILHDEARRMNSYTRDSLLRIERQQRRALHH